MPSIMDGQKMQAIYHDVDTDNNGYITRDELQAYKEKNGLNDLNVDVSQDVGVAVHAYDNNCYCVNIKQIKVIRLLLNTRLFPCAPQKKFEAVYVHRATWTRDN